MEGLHLPPHFGPLVLMSIGLAAAALGAAGVAVQRSVYGALHSAALGTMLGSVFIGAAVVAREGGRSAGLKTILLVVITLLTAPAITHATARAARLRQRAVSPEAAGDPAQQGAHED